MNLIYLGILSSAKKSALFDDNNNYNNNKEIIQGKKIIFNEEMSNLNLIQNRKNSNFYMSELKEENKPSFFLSPIKANNNDKEINYQNVAPATGNPQNKINVPPNGSMYTLSPNANENINNKIINGGSQDKSNINTNVNYQDYSNINYNRKNSKNVTCTCTRTQCQKKYCACYARGKPCIGCDCKGCLNNQRDKNTIYPEGGEIYNNNNPKEEEININRNICQDSKSHSIVCNCTKSRCMKKYCECYKMNIPCGSLCRCIDCQNKNNPNIYPSLNNNNSDKSMNMVNNLDDNRNIMNDSQKSNMQNDNIERIKEISKSFSIISMEIYINNKKLIIQEREIDLNKSKINLNTTPKMTNKKRARGKNENSNLRTCPTTISASRRKKRGYSQVNSNVKTKKLLIN